MLEPFDGLERGAYDLIFIDPPWTFNTWSAKGKEKKSPENHYECQGIEWVRQLPVRDYAAENCLLWLWATNPLLDQQIDVLKQWGFTFKTAGTWVKMTKTWSPESKKWKQAFGTGYILRSANEPFLIGTIGKPKTTRSVRSAIFGAVREHSRKPESAYAAAEKLMPGARRADIFSRQRRPGWDAWGDEINKFGEGEP